MPKQLTQQEGHPHPQLVQCRNTLEKVLNLTRQHAATICNRLSNKQVEMILAAGGDAAKVQKAVEHVEAEVAEEKQNEEQEKTTTKKK